MLDIKIIAIGKIKEQAIKQMTEEYLKRIRPFARLEVVELSEEPFVASNAAKAKEKEGEKIVEAFSRFQGAYVIAMDEGGTEHDSIGLARYLEKQNTAIIFIIGGSLGLSEKVLSYCHAKLALSRLTFTHEMARLFLVEQIYRGTTIISGKKYHH